MLPIIEGALGGGVRCLRGIRYNERTGMNRPAFAMQQCAERISFFSGAENIAYRWRSGRFSAYFAVVTDPNPEIHMIVIGVSAWESTLADACPVSNRQPDERISAYAALKAFLPSASSAANSSSDRMMSTAAVFSSRCLTLPVPGIGSITGLRFSTHARAIWLGAALCFFAMVSSSEPSLARSPAASGNHGMKPMPCFSQ